MSRARDLAAFVSNADGDIKFDTDTLFIDSSANRVGIGTTTPATQIELSSTDPTLRFNDSNGGTDTKNFELRYVGTNSPDIDGLYFRTVNDANSVYTNKVAILGSGNVGIGTDSPEAVLHAQENGNASKKGLQISNYDTTAGTNQAINVDFGLARNSGATKAEAGRIKVGRNADWTSADNNIDSYMSLSVYNNNSLSEKVRVLPSGGITFNGDTAAANALDDYEEGFHQISVNSGGVSFNSLYDDFRYTKIGRMVHVEGLFLASSSGNSDTLEITLPFSYSAKSVGSADSVMGVVGSYQGPMGSSGLVCAISQNQSLLRFRKLADDAVWTTVVGSDIDSSDHLYINITYPTG